MPRDTQSPKRRKPSSPRTRGPSKRDDTRMGGYVEARPSREQQEFDRRMHAIVMEWGEFHKECRLPACRRHRRCAHMDACRVVRDAPPMTEAEIAEINATIRRALDMDRAEREGRPAPVFDHEDADPYSRYVTTPDARS
jgi:hypothetical protein